ncbi:MAG: hypothetical protein M1338_03500 [Patescibacteria group bacterium]|nr:hypothetical protein [Patescibacteria group bacterium]
MTTTQLEEQINIIHGLVPQIEETNCESVKELRPNMREELRKVKILPPLTAGGLESVNTVLGYLYWAEFLAKKEIDKRREKNIEANTPNQPTNQPKPISLGPRPKIKPATPSSLPPKTGPRPKSKSSLDFGPFDAQNK